MRRLAGTALICSSAFVAIVALLSDAPALFYMGTALLATIATARLQSYLSVRALRFQRFAPELASIGEKVKVELVVWSERNIRRPLVYINDVLPPRFLVANRTPSLPVAPDFRRAVRTEYAFQVRRRGVFRWSGVEAVGTDALGLVSTTKTYSTDVVEMTVLPVSIPIGIDLPAAAGWGVSEASSGENKGASGEPRGIREYSSGDSLRHVHWRTSARTGILHVKEFEAGSHTSTALFFQRSNGSDLLSESALAGDGSVLSSLDLMAGHALHVSETLLRQGARVSLPQLESADAKSSPDRRGEIALLLALLQANSRSSLGEEIIRAADSLPEGSILLAFVVQSDPTLAEAIPRLRSRGIQLVALLYDSDAFSDRKKQSKERSAADPAFAEWIRGAGGRSVLMPSAGGAA